MGIERVKPRCAFFGNLNSQAAGKDGRGRRKIEIGLLAGLRPACCGFKCKIRPGDVLIKCLGC